MDLSQNDVIEILKFIGESEYNELHLEIGDLKLVVNKGKLKSAVRKKESEPKENEDLVFPKKSFPAKAGQDLESLKSLQAQAQAENGKPEETSQFEQEGLIPIESPMLGTFYRRPKPNDLPFVEVGTIVHEEDTVCIVEVMKLFSSIKAGVHGRIALICAEDGQMVEYKQALFMIEKLEENADKKTKASRA